MRSDSLCYGDPSGNILASLGGKLLFSYHEPAPLLAACISSLNKRGCKITSKKQQTKKQARKRLLFYKKEMTASLRKRSNGGIINLL